jgi:hypothetical protein
MNVGMAYNVACLVSVSQQRSRWEDEDKAKAATLSEAPAATLAQSHAPLQVIPRNAAQGSALSQPQAAEPASPALPSSSASPTPAAVAEKPHSDGWFISAEKGLSNFWHGT